MAPGVVFVLSDGIKGHIAQVRGLARSLSERCGAPVEEAAVPRLSGLRRFELLKVRSRFLPRLSRRKVEAWLEDAGGVKLLQQFADAVERAGCTAEAALILSCGSGAAPFALALARLCGAKSCTVMTPSIGLSHFDFAIVPGHDAPPARRNVFVTLGALNDVDRNRIEEEGKALSEAFPPESEKRWALLIGGDDANYRVSPAWAREMLSFLLEWAAKRGADLYIPTSRRTLRETEAAIEELCAASRWVRMLCLASKGERNPVYGMLGLATNVLCTEDSVSMISEAATAGFRVGVLSVEHALGVGTSLQRLALVLARRGFLSEGRLWGLPRFDKMIDSFCSRSLAMRLDDESALAAFLETPQLHGADFDETGRAARWLLENLNWQVKNGIARASLCG